MLSVYIPHTQQNCQCCDHKSMRPGHATGASFCTSFTWTLSCAKQKFMHKASPCEIALKAGTDGMIETGHSINTWGDHVPKTPCWFQGTHERLSTLLCLVFGKCRAESVAPCKDCLLNAQLMDTAAKRSRESPACLGCCVIIMSLLHGRPAMTNLLDCSRHSREAGRHSSQQQQAPPAGHGND